MIGRLLRALRARLREPSMGPPSPPVPDAAFLIGVAAMFSHEVFGDSSRE